MTQRVLTENEQSMAEVMWLGILGGSRFGVFREVRKGIQSVKITGVAFLADNFSGSINRVTGLKGHFHPAQEGGQKTFDITGVRVGTKWFNGDEIWKILDTSIQQTGFRKPGSDAIFYVRLDQ